MAKLYKAMCIVFLVVAIIGSIYLCANVVPVHTAVEKSYNEQFTVKINPSGFNTLLFILCLFFSVFSFAAAWCFGDIAQAARKYITAPFPRRNTDAKQMEEAANAPSIYPTSMGKDTICCPLCSTTQPKNNAYCDGCGRRFATRSN
ncbi:MAG: hypothetical protein RR224_12625 [Clostridia bacterium]